jgi:hypothetical protein
MAEATLLEKTHFYLIISKWGIKSNIWFLLVFVGSAPGLMEKMPEMTK